MRSTKLTRAALLCALPLACSRTERPAPVRLEPAPLWVSVPAPADVGERCADVGKRRVCFVAPSTAAPAGVVSVPQPEAPEPAPPRGLRCSGHGNKRACQDRALGSSELACSDGICLQWHPRLPDDGEWECADLSGVVVCRSWSNAAGVVAALADPAWFCGPRRGAPGERICVDFAPDRPEPEPHTCRFDYHAGRPPRVCRRGGSEPLGRACGSGCPLGSTCASGHCLPLPPNPACWVDGDCGTGAKCAFGTCLEVGR